MGSRPRSSGEGKSFPVPDEASSKPENETVIRIGDTEFLGILVKTETLEFRVEVAMPNTKPAHDVAITIEFYSAHRIKMIEGDVDVTKRSGVIRPPEERFGPEGLGRAVIASQSGHARADGRL